MERLSALVPHHREHCWTYHGPLAPAWSLQDRIVLGLAVELGEPAIDVEDAEDRGCTSSLTLVWSTALKDHSSRAAALDTSGVQSEATFRHARAATG